MPEQKYNRAALVLGANKEKILSFWEERARQELPAARSKGGLALRDHLPALLDNLVAALSPAVEQNNAEISNVGEEHGNQRSRLGDYSLGQILSEYSLLRKSIFGVLEVELKQSLPSRERDIILDCISLAMQSSAEEFADKAKQRLQRSNEELQSFAYAASHDLQEPLRTISNYVRLSQQRLKSSPDQKLQEFFGFIIGGADRMRQLVSGLLEYARVGAANDEKERADLDAVLKEVLANLELLIRESGATVVASPLPCVQGNPSLYCNLFQNLIANAIKYCTQKPPQIVVSQLEDAGCYVITVADNGIGIEPQHREQIFRLFNRLHPRSKYEGVGIGLALCKRIVDSHGGRIWVETNPSGGSMFRFSLPIPGKDNA